MSTNIAYDFMDSGYRIFGLHGGDGRGGCACGNPDCQAAFKHPIAGNWQHTPEWSEEQIEVMEELGQLATGYGVIVKGLLVVDVDARNGGVESYERLIARLGTDLAANAGLTVQTGSGQGSMHIYYTAPEGISLVQGHPDFKGIDFKSSGFCVGPGSRHASGNTYEILFGGPHSIGEPPAELIELLKRPDSFRAEYNGASLDVTEADLAEMLRHISPDVDHDTWVKCGMALHHATGGTGFHLWNSWSSPGESYPGASKLEKRWHSFGKSSNPVTLGTLIHHAEAGGWVEPVEFTPTTWFDETGTGMADVNEARQAAEVPPSTPSENAESVKPIVKIKSGEPFHTNGIDLLRPPGFVGEVCKWINAQSRFPRENLAVMAALQCVGSIGMRYTCQESGVTTNMFAVGVAESSTGKEAILDAMGKLHRAANISGATHGNIKSEQEIIRNLIEHQAATYLIDEWGLTLDKITNSKESYFSGVVGTLMSIYSKANSFYQLTGDAKRDARKELLISIKNSRKMVADNEDPSGRIQEDIPRLERALSMVDQGLEMPFLSLTGLTTGLTFERLVTPDQARNGFIGRSILVTEKESNPREKPNFKAEPLKDKMAMSLTGIYDGGTFDPNNRRIGHDGPKTPIRSDREALDMLDSLREWAHDLSEYHKEKTGFEPIVRRAREMILKISLILAVPGGVRTAEHVRWAYAFVNRDIHEKIRLAYANEVGDEDPVEAIKVKIVNLLGDGHIESEGVIVGRFRAIERKEKGIIKKVLDRLVSGGSIMVSEKPHPKNGTTIKHYYLP